MTDVQRQPLDTGDLWKWVQRLTRDRKQRLLRKPLPGHGKPHVEYVPVPSLLTQLGEALASDNTGGGTGKASPGSRAPIDVAIEDLFDDMSTRVRAALLELGGTPRVLRGAPLESRRALPDLYETFVDEDGRQHRIPLYDPDVAGQLVAAAGRAAVTRDQMRYRHDLASDLQQLPVLLVGTRRQPLVDEWVGRYRAWVALAETILTADDEAIDLRGIRGHACPSCGESFVERTEPSTDPRAVDGVERYRDPALVIAFRDGQVQHITCRACDTGWWRGEDVDELSADIRATEPAVERPPRPAVDYSGDVNHGGRLSGLNPDRWWPSTGGAA